jgi:hypothetical protein
VHYLSGFTVHVNDTGLVNDAGIALALDRTIGELPG